MAPEALKRQSRTQGKVRERKASLRMEVEVQRRERCVLTYTC